MSRQAPLDRGDEQNLGATQGDAAGARSGNDSDPDATLVDVPVLHATNLPVTQLDIDCVKRAGAADEPTVVIGPDRPASDFTGPGDAAPAELPAAGPIDTIADFEASCSTFASTPVARRPIPTVPGFEVIGELGRGGMSVVYLARRALLNRPCALKMILAGEHAGPEAPVRFLAEAEAVARLRHPNVVQIYSIGECDGRPYLELEYAEAGSLEKQVDGTPWPPKRAAGLVEPLARAVAEAHRLGIVHRDLKPGNVLLFADGTPKVADFGLVKSVGSDHALTRTDSVLGSPSYMAPEQAEGHSREAGLAADVYSLGAILYELLTGRPPFRGATALQTLEQVKTTEPVPPVRLVPGLARDADTIALKCLQKDPERRYSSAGALADDLGRFLAGEPILARPVGAGERVWRWCRRNPTVASLLAAVAVLLFVSTVGSGVAAWLIAAKQVETAKARDEARESFTRAEHGRVEVERQRRAAAAQALRLTLDRARDLGERQEIGEGMLWMARALAMLPAADVHLRRAVCASLAAWDRRLSSLRAITPMREFANPTSVAFSQDGSQILTGDLNGAAQLADTATGQPIGPLMTHPAAVRAVAIRPDGRRLATLDARGDIRIWDAQTSAPVGRPLRLPFPGFAIAFSPDGTRIATTLADTSIRIWEVENGLQVAEMKRRVGSGAIAFSADGTRIVNGAGDGTAQVFESATGQPIGGPLVHRGSVKAVAMSPDGQRVLTGCMSFTAQLWDVATGNPIGPPLEHENEVHAVAFSPDGRRLFTASTDGTARLWDVDTGKPLGSPLRHRAGVAALAFAAGGSRLLTAGGDRVVKIWDTLQGLARGAPLRHDAPILSVAFSPDGKRLLTASFDHTAKLWDGETGQPIGAPLRHAAPLGDAAFRPGGMEILTGAWDGVARFWDARTGESIDRPLRNTPFGDATNPRWVNRPNGTAVIDLAFSPDGTMVVLGLADWTARRWDPIAGKPIGPPIPHNGHVHSVSFRPDGRRFLTSDIGGHARQWDATIGQQVGPVLRPGAAVQCAVFSPDGKRILTSTYVGVAQQWDAETGAPLGEPIFHEGDIRRCAYSPDGTLILTGSSDRLARLWDAATGLPIGPPLPHAGAVKAVAFSPDGSRFLTGDSLGDGQLWDTPPAPWKGDDAAILSRVQVATGLELDEHQRVRVLDRPNWEDRRRQLGSEVSPSEPSVSAPKRDQRP